MIRITHDLEMKSVPVWKGKTWRCELIGFSGGAEIGLTRAVPSHAAVHATPSGKIEMGMGCGGRSPLKGCLKVDVDFAD